MVQSFLTATPNNGLINSDQQFSGSSEPAPVIPDRANNPVDRGETPTSGGNNGPVPASSSAHATEFAGLASDQTGQDTVVPIESEIATHTEPDRPTDPPPVASQLLGTAGLARRRRRPIWPGPVSFPSPPFECSYGHLARRRRRNPPLPRRIQRADR